ncbi:MAG TPA: plastocyanin/azurin family copper-binding protein [Alphaproteobacteria bacterium]|nr:plastocyanin/azurin family copper-binding protein [Alphaproteobacteria bacterium]
MAMLLGGCGLSGPAHGPPVPGMAAVVDMSFESYDPANVTIRAGQTVEWRNTSIITHTVTDDPARARKADDAGVPAGGQAFDSGDIPPGQVYSHAFTVPGTYRYFCAHHEQGGMLGVVVVTPAP